MKNANSPRMHVARIERTVNGKTYLTVLIRRSYREGKAVKHETLANISHLSERLIDIIRRSLQGEEFTSAKDAFRITRSKPHGHVEAVLAMIAKLGIPNLLAATPSRQRDILVAMIAQRLLFPASKLATTRHWHSTTLAEELGIADTTVQELYQAMDWLVSRQKAIEDKLAQRHLAEGALVLYDLSSSFYEGHTCPLAQYGHNRDGKKGLPIILYGLLTNDDGRPVAVDVYPGNVADSKTVPDQVEKLRGRFGLERVVLAGDRGMLTQTQIKNLQQYPGLGWISALRSTDIKALLAGDHLQRSLFDDVNLAEISSPEFPGERLMACFNPMLADERRQKRHDLLKRTEEELTRLTKEVDRRKKKPLTQAEIAYKAGRVVGKWKMAKHFDLTFADGVFKWSRRHEAIAQEEQLDGIYVIRTSEPEERLSAADTVRCYKRLTQVEQAFRSFKGIDLMVRPIYHRVDPRVRAHIFLCMLAYYIQWHLKKAWASLLFADEELDANRDKRDPVLPAKPSESAKEKKKTKQNADGQEVHSFRTLLEELATRCRNTCIVSAENSNATFLQNTEATPLQAEALRLINSWTEPGTTD